MRELLFRLLCNALWDERYCEAISEKEFLGVLSIAEHQTIFGLVFDALKEAQVADMEDKMPIYEAIGTLEQIKQQNKLCNKELVDFVRLCDENGLGYIVVKGQTIESLYPNRGLRQSGDTDFLIKKQQYALFGKALEIELPEKLSEKEFGFERKGLQYELHTDLIEFATKRHQEVWDELIAKEWGQEYYVEIEGVKVRTLSPTLNAAYIFIHLFFHFIREGVSLRQLCDWAMVLHHYKDEINRDELLQILNDLDLCEAYCAFGTILVDKLGLPVSELPVPINDEARKWQEKILNDIFRGGNFGKNNHKARFSWKYKVETFNVALRNSFKYYCLCPSEVGGMIPRLVKGNARIWLKALFNKVRRQSRAQD